MLDTDDDACSAVNDRHSRFQFLIQAANMSMPTECRNKLNNNIQNSPAPTKVTAGVVEPDNDFIDDAQENSNFPVDIQRCHAIYGNFGYSRFSSSIDSNLLTRDVYQIYPSIHNQSCCELTLVMKLVIIDGTLRLVPVNDIDSSLLFECCVKSCVPQSISVILENERCLYTSANLCGQSFLTSPSFHTPVHCDRVIECTLPKHIYKTHSGTYRVQVGKGSKQNRNGKFSRNARTETEALWLCEIALISIDSPTNLEDIIRDGNYQCLLERGLVKDHNDFALQLVEQTELMKDKGMLDANEIQRVVAVLRLLFPPAVLESMSSSRTLLQASSSASEVVPRSMAPRKRRRSSKQFLWKHDESLLPQAL